MDIERPFWHPSASQGFLLDWDGVIADTKLDFSKIRKRYYGGRNAMLLEEADAMPLGERESLISDLYELEMEGAKNAVPVPGAFALLSWLKRHGRTFCIISRNCAESVETAAKAIGLTLPSVVFTRDNSEHLKPDPAALYDAASAIGVPLDCCVLIGDFIYDIFCARRAGVRTVLVQRSEPGWEEMADIFYPRVTDLTAALEAPVPIVPWEYREIFAKRGDKWLNKVYALNLELPTRPSPTTPCWLARAAALGVGSVTVPKNAVLSAAEWKINPDFDLSMIGKPLIEAARSYLARRFPMLEVREGDEGLKSPRNSLDLVRFIERKVY